MSEKIPSLETLTATHPSGREHTLEVQEKKPLGKGNFGDVYEIKATLKRESSEENTEAIERVKERIFALKDFRGNEAQATRSKERHQMLRDFGFPTYTTYRGVGTDSVLMTHLNREGSITLSSSGSDASIHESTLEKVHEITGLEKAVSELAEHLLEASLHKVVIHHDSYFYNFSPNPKKLPLLKKITNAVSGRRSIQLNQILVGDFDTVVKASESSDFEGAVIVNFAEFMKSFVFLGEKIFPKSQTLNVPEKQKAYAVIEKAIYTVFKKHELEYILPGVAQHAHDVLYGNPYEDIEVDENGKRIQRV